MGPPPIPASSQWVLGVLQNLALYPLLFLLSGAPPVWVWWIVAQQAHVGSCVSTSLCLQLSERAGRGESGERLENHVQTSPCNSPQQPLPGRQWEPCPRIFILSVSSPLRSQGWVGGWESCSPTGLEAMMGPLLLCLLVQLFWWTRAGASACGPRVGVASVIFSCLPRLPHSLS